MSHTVPILILEDNEIDVEIAKRVLKKGNISNPFYAVADGVEALKALKGDGTEKIPQPCIILIDINLPRMDGFTFLEEVQNDPELKDNIAFMLTTSNREEDMNKAYSLNAAGYILKDEIDMLGKAISDYV